MTRPSRLQSPSPAEATEATLAPLRRELQDHYAPLRRDRLAGNAPYLERRDRIWQAMDAFAAAHLEMPAVQLKARLHEEIAAQFEPVIFPHSPFFFEMGVRPAENWGTPEPWCAASWLHQRRQHLCRNTPQWQNVWACHIHNPDSPLKIWGIWDVFDADHHCIGYSKLLSIGINGLLEQIAARERSATAAQAPFLDAASRSCQALLRCAGRFADAAGTRLEAEPDPDARRCLSMLAAAARRVPAEPPSTFLEALASLWFLREAMASLESIGISVVGHLDRQLIGWYRRDLQEGRLTEADAADLLARWMLPTDVKFHIEDNPWPETSTCMELGGCDEQGHPVFNELTRLIIDTHHRHRLLNPKLNCRYSAASPSEYLEQMASKALAGHNHFAFLNDDVIIPALVRAGKAESHARLYVNGGCQEPMAEGYEHSAGAYYYLNMARVFDLFLRPAGPDIPAHVVNRDVRAILPGSTQAPASFEALYVEFVDQLIRLTRQGALWAQEPGRRWRDVHPCPLFSASLHGCVESATDYTAGGAVYNPSGIALVGFGTVVDSLFVVKKAVFDEHWCTLEDLATALAADWQGHEALRARCIRLPKYGHGNSDVDALAARFARDLGERCRSIPNERGGSFQASLFVYYFFATLAGDVRATPDGRHTGDWLSQGASPGRLRPADSMTAILESVGRIDFRDFPANAVVDVQFPVNGARPDVFAAVLRSFARGGGQTLQVSCASPAELRDAQQHPEQHADLTVRISGLSARFVALTRPVQDEIIARTMVRV